MLKIVFVGHMDHEPNVDAVRFFAEEVWPILFARIGPIAFDVIGPASDALVRWGEEHHVRFRGFIENLPGALAEYDVYVAPLRLGSGTKIKVLDAMANSIPLVATSVAAEGLGLEHGVSAILADSAFAIAEGIAALNASPELGARLAQTAQEIASSRFRWSQIRESLADDISTLLDGATRRQEGRWRSRAA